ncbi:PREDICTED: uncharacterized protein LOC109586202 [Amphimedon queenslandica]|uniref:Uncharacterized protein n=1 Tax=Amphimedon queenslandica TaxID=400682 RepID=A0AAN0JLR2_AMPQE|nr:PREDICTED: uncharacterized protein LOC109586202 [Amphimedon queenslandica]|eukprot:XP_019857936.1 PREDICTED: uncharacterized protein LOC109586202 [Amphimedon queenslandica]
MHCQLLMADPVSEILQCYIDRLAQVVLTEESVDLLHTEGLISKDTLTEVKSCGCSLVGDPMLLILSGVAEDHSKLCTLTSILMKSQEAVSLASDIIMEYGKSFPSAVTVMPPSCQQVNTSTSSRSGQLQDSSSETQVATNTDATPQESEKEESKKKMTKAVQTEIDHLRSSLQSKTGIEETLIGVEKTSIEREKEIEQLQEKISLMNIQQLKETSITLSMYYIMY